MKELFNAGVRIFIQGGRIHIVFPADGEDAYGAELCGDNVVMLLDMKERLWQEVDAIERYVRNNQNNDPLALEQPIPVIKLFGGENCVPMNQGLIVTAMLLPDNTVELTGRVVSKVSEFAIHDHSRAKKVKITVQDLKNLRQVLVDIA